METTFLDFVSLTAAFFDYSQVIKWLNGNDLSLI